jgi:hypothetical protein
MRKTGIAAVYLALAAALSSAQFYAGMDPQRREKLAEDYYLAGSQYLAAGLDKGREFQELALQMDPALDPRTIAEPVQPSAAELLARTNVSVAGPREADTSAALIRTRLLRLIGAMLTEDATAAAANLDGSLYLTDYPPGGGQAVSRAAAQRELDTFFGQVTLRGVLPSQLYRLDSLAVSAAPPGLVARGWADAYIADIDAAMDLSGSLPLWSGRQRFYFRPAEGTWLVFAFGLALPPTGWRPAAVPGASAEPPSVTPTSGEQRATIEASFLGCVARFLQKDAEGALRYFAPRVRLERLSTTVARDELGNAFRSYFGSMDFGGLATGDLVEPQSVFVVETERFPELASGRRYVLTVQTRLDLADRIPFWTRFQEYYFTLVEGTWRIYAIF